MGRVDLLRCAGLLALLAMTGCASWLRGDDVFGPTAGASPYSEAPRPPLVIAEGPRQRLVVLRVPDGYLGPVVVTCACAAAPAPRAYRPSPYEDEALVSLPPKPSPYEDPVDVPPSPYGYD